ncbi:MAG: glycosyltransferase, partial [Pyrinomonadaceae bacterium]
MRIVSIVEATTLNAVARITLEFFRTARELTDANAGTPAVEGSVITFDRDSDQTESPNKFVLATRAAGIEIDVIPERRRFDLSVIPALKRIIEQRQPDVVITHSVKSHFLMWRSRLWKKYPWVAFHHGYTTTDQKMRLYNRFDRWSLPKAQLVITVCDAFAQELNVVARVPRDNIRVQHNPIRITAKPDPAAVQAQRKHLGIGENERVILSVGRLSNEKAHADLIAAFQRLCQTEAGQYCKLVIVGDGPERARLEAQAEETGYGQRIFFTGQMGDVRPFYAMAAVVVLPSHSEGSPYALLEAMAAKVPVVATAVGGVPEMVEDEESALLIPGRD